MKRSVEILVADDELGMCRLLGAILKSCDFLDVKITYAIDGVGAVDALKQKNIQIAFIDINMPGENGINVVQQARQICPSCFCVMVSGDSAVQTVRSALAAGARGFIVKPYTEQKIFDVLAKFAAIA